MSSKPHTPVIRKTTEGDCTAFSVELGVVSTFHLKAVLCSLRVEQVAARTASASGDLEYPVPNASKVRLKPQEVDGGGYVLTLSTWTTSGCGATAERMESAFRAHVQEFQREIQSFYPVAMGVQAELASLRREVASLRSELAIAKDVLPSHCQRIIAVEAAERPFDGYLDERITTLEERLSRLSGELEPRTPAVATPLPRPRPWWERYRRDFAREEVSRG